MKKKYIIIIVGVFVTILGMGMFAFGVSMFTYHGPPISNFVSKAGMYSFMFCLPTLVIGLTILILGIFMKNRSLPDRS